MPLKMSRSAEITAKPKLSAQSLAHSYLTEHKIFELYNFLIGHLLVDEPDDPIAYLYDLLDKCILFRTGLIDPPLHFRPRHLEALFDNMNTTGSGKISLNQYEKCMQSLSITDYKQIPTECTPGYVDKKTFVEEAHRCLSETLMEMLGESMF